MSNKILFPSSKKYKVKDEKELSVKFDHKDINKIVDFWDKQLLSIMTIRTNLAIYRKLVSLGMNKEAERVLETSCILLDEMKLQQIKMENEIKSYDDQDSTKSINYGKIILKAV